MTTCFPRVLHSLTDKSVGVRDSLCVGYTVTSHALPFYARLASFLSCFTLSERDLQILTRLLAASHDI